MSKRRLNARQIKLKTELADGKPLKTAMLNAGYSAHTARQGVAGIPKVVLAAMGKDGMKYAELGKALDPKTQEHLVRGMLAFNVMRREDKGVLSAKALGSDRSVNMWTPDIQTGVVILEAPRYALENREALLKPPED